MPFNLRTTRCFVGLALLVSLTLAGCEEKKELGIVSGQVTMDGRPLKQVEIVFSPLPESNQDATAGPYSTAITDGFGKYTLATRYGEPGAVIGKHRVSFEYLGFDPSVEDELRQAILEARQDGDEDAAGRAMAKLEEAKSRERMPAKYNPQSSTLEATVAGGDNDLDFELTSDSSSLEVGKDNASDQTR